GRSDLLVPLVALGFEVSLRQRLGAIAAGPRTQDGLESRPRGLGRLERGSRPGVSITRGLSRLPGLLDLARGLGAPLGEAGALRSDVSPLSLLDLRLGL